MKNLLKIKFSLILSELDKYGIKITSSIPSNEIFEKINTISKSSENDITFFSNKKYLKELKKLKAKACFIENKYIDLLPDHCSPVVVEDPYLCLAIISNIFNISKKSNGIISEFCFIDKTCKLHNNIQINSFSYIDQNTEIFDDVIIGSNSKIGPNVKIYSNVEIQDNVSISNAVIKSNCFLQSGSRIGGSGFGFEEKTKQRIFHSGNVIIENNCNIGSNTTIDRAVFESTIIGKNSHLDNLVQIAHNVEIGDHAIIAAQVGIAGSTKIGKFVKIGGQAGISGHLKIGDNVTIAAKSGVTKNINDDRIVAGFPAKDINIWKKEIIRNSIKK